MAVAPSLVFYVLQLGGTKEQYGLIMSTFSFANFCVKPIYGNWVDRHGNKYRAPYVASLTIAIVGALLYFFATSYSSSPAIAIAMVFVGRLLSGLGAGNQALGYAYTASVASQETQTRTSAMLSMAKILGMTLGPGVNYFLGKVDSNLFGVPVNPLNSVGLLLAALNLIAAVVVFLMLPEPTSSSSSSNNNDKASIAAKLKTAAGDLSSERPSFIQYWDLYLRIELLLPMFLIFAANSAFQLVETALAPAADHGLGWGPVETSGVLSATSIVVFILMALVMFLSSKKVKDTTLVAIGNILFIIGGSCIYLCWTDNVTSAAQYVVPTMIAVSGFPFISSPNRSNFTRAVKSHSALESSQATMQAVLSMFPSLAGFLYVYLLLQLLMVFHSLSMIYPSFASLLFILTFICFILFASFFFSIMRRTQKVHLDSSLPLSYEVQKK